MTLILDETLEQTFTDLIAATIEDQHFTLSSPAQVYVIDTLVTFVTPRVVADAHVRIFDLLREAQGSKGPVRRECLRAAGDTALVLTGMFPERLRARRVVVTFGDFVGVGQEAYGSLHSEVFAELSSKFLGVVDVLNDTSAKIALSSGDVKDYLWRRRLIDGHLARR